MPSLFHGSSVERLLERRAQVEREIAALQKFRDKIDRRIAYLDRDSDETTRLMRGKNGERLRYSLAELVARMPERPDD